MAKKKSGVSLKQLFLEKGERYGFYLAAAILVLFLTLGGMKAVTSASPNTIVGKFDKGVKDVEQKIRQKPGQDPKALDPVIYGDSTVPEIPFNKVVARNDLFDQTLNERTTRLNPQIIPPVAAQVDFVRGSIGSYQIFEQNGELYISVLTERAAVHSDPQRINRLVTRIRGRQGQPRPPQPVPVAPPAAGGNSPAGGPRRGGPPILPGQGMGAGADMQVQIKKLSDKDIDQARLAETLDPRRMVVVTLAVPYKAQVEEYRRKLRAKDRNSISEYPEYRGFVVERRQLVLDGATEEQGWTAIDMQATLHDMFARTIDFEPEYPPTNMAPDLQALYPRVIPDESFELVIPRPKLYHGEYPPVNLPAITSALKALAASGDRATEVQTQTQQRVSEVNVFNRGSATDQTPGGAIGRPTLPGGPGRGFRPGMRIAIPPANPNNPNQQMQRVEDEDAWLMRFIDITTEPGHVYQYRVALKALNPNFHKPAKELAMPSLADKEMLQSEFFEVPTSVVVPPEEFLYAAAKNEHQHRVTERMPSPGLWDETWVQLQHWYAYVSPKDEQLTSPFGEWLVADIKAIRGQKIGETAQVLLPLWSMENTAFLFRDPPRRRPSAPSVTMAPREAGADVADRPDPHARRNPGGLRGGDRKLCQPETEPCAGLRRRRDAPPGRGRPAPGGPERPGPGRRRASQTGRRLDQMVDASQRSHQREE